jgi:hypothetical protein
MEYAIELCLVSTYQGITTGKLDFSLFIWTWQFSCVGVEMRGAGLSTNSAASTSEDKGGLPAVLHCAVILTTP